MFGDVTIPGEVMAGIITVFVVIGGGISSWMLTTLVRLTNVVTSLEERLDGHEKRIDRIDPGHA
jgi:hypothetical protein